MNACAVPLKEGEFTQVEFTPLSMSETPTYLKYLMITGGEQSLHTQFGGGMQEPVTGADGINVGFRGGCRVQVGGLNLQVSMSNEITPYGLDNPGT